MLGPRKADNIVSPGTAIKRITTRKAPRRRNATSALPSTFRITFKLHAMALIEAGGGGGANGSLTYVAVAQPASGDPSVSTVLTGAAVVLVLLLLVSSGWAVLAWIRAVENKHSARDVRSPVCGEENKSKETV
jgi:hypothetical protein